MRCAGLLSKLGDAGSPVARDGSGTVTEVYPAASLKRWDCPGAAASSDVTLAPWRNW